jgi:tight adherence protein B
LYLPAVRREGIGDSIVVSGANAVARLTGWVLVLMPVVIALAMVIVAPEHILTLVNDPLGIQMTFVALVLWLVGYLAIRRLVDVEY